MTGKGRTSIRVGLDTGEADRELKGLQGSFKRAGSAIERQFGGALGGAVGKLGSAIGPIGVGMGAVAAGATAAAVAFKRFADQTDQLGKTAQRLNIGTEALGGLRHAADLAGVATGTMETALRKMQKRAVDAREGNKKLAQAYSDLGLSADAVSRAKPEQAIGMIADALNNVEDPAKRSRLSMQLLGDVAGPQLQTMLSGGSEAINAQIAEAKALGLTMDEGTTGSVARFQDNLTRMQAVLSGATRQLMVGLTPAFEVVSTVVFETTKQLGGMPGIMRSVGDTILTLIEGGLNFGKVFQIIPAAAMAAFAGMRVAVAEAVNFLIRQVEGVLDYLPDRVRNFITGGSQNSLQIDTSAMQREAEAAARVLSETINAEGLGTEIVNRVRASIEADRERGGPARPSAPRPAPAPRAPTPPKRKAGEKDKPETSEAKDREDKRRPIIKETRDSVREGVATAKEAVEEEGKGLLDSMGQLGEQAVGVFGGMGQAIGGAFEAAFTGGNFGEALKASVGQMLTTLGTQLIQSSIYTAFMGLLASIPIIGAAFGGPPAAAMALPLAPIALAAGIGLVAAGSALGGSGGGGRGASLPSAPGGGGGGGRPPRAPDAGARGERVGPGFGQPQDRGPSIVNVNFNGATNSRRTRRELREVFPVRREAMA